MKKLQIISLSTFFIVFLISLNSSAQIPIPEEGKGLVVFYRTKKFSGSAIKFSVKDSERTYGQLKNGTIININVEPGEHMFWSQVISSDAILKTM